MEHWITECGVSGAALLGPKDIVTSSLFRDICRQNACGNYNQCYMCPPNVGEIQDLMAEVHQYAKGVLYQTIHNIEDSFDIEGMMEAAKVHTRCCQVIEQEAEVRYPNGFLHLSAGSCNLCDRCAKRDSLPCRHPDQALPSLESYGVNVHDTAENVGLPYINGANTVTYFGAVLYEEKKWER